MINIITHFGIQLPFRDEYSLRIYIKRSSPVHTQQSSSYIIIFITYMGQGVLTVAIENSVFHTNY